MIYHSFRHSNKVKDSLQMSTGPRAIEWTTVGNVEKMKAKEEIKTQLISGTNKTKSYTRRADIYTVIIDGSVFLHFVWDLVFNVIFLAKF